MFKTSKISFCNKQACNVVEDTFKEEILDILQKNYYVSIKDKNFYIVNPKNIKYIEKNPHFLSVKSSGSLYYLFLTRIDQKNYCFYIDKKIKEGHKCPRIISVNYRFGDELFDNTLFDGELLRDRDENWLYIINNLVIHKGTLLKDKHINHKLDIVYDILTNHYQKDSHLEICPLYVKRLFANHEFGYIIKTYIPTLNFNPRGIYFEGIRNLNNHLFLFPRGQRFETKPKEETKVEILPKKKKIIKTTKGGLNGRKSLRFMVRKTEISDIYNLYSLKDDEIYKYGGAHIPNLKTSKFMRKAFTNGIDNITMNCEYNDKMEKWNPVEITTEPVDDLSLVEEYLNLQ